MTRRASRVYCSVYGCLNSTLVNPTMSFFKLPAEAERRSEWLRLMCREDLLQKPHRGYSVCEYHFAEKDILPGSHRKKLKKSSLPILYLPISQKKDQETQTMDIQTLTDKTTQTLSENTPCKNKLKSRKTLNNPYEVGSQSQKIKITKNMFYKICDKFLTKELAMLVKADTDSKSKDKVVLTQTLKVENMTEEENNCREFNS